MTVRDALRDAARMVSNRDADLLLAHVLRKDRVWFVAHGDEELSHSTVESLHKVLTRRASGEPLQYIVGVQEFFGLAIHVGPSVLIPRPETEHLVEAVLDVASSRKLSLRIVDVGTGSGAIALALAKNLPDCDIIATDISPEALKLAMSNATQLGLTSRIHFQEADLLTSLKLSQLDIVVSNPPYVPVHDAREMQKEVVDHEPHGALFAGEDGLSIYRRLIPQARSALRFGGLLAMEIGFGQSESLRELLTGWDNVRFIQDYAGIPRVVLAERV